MTFAQKNFQPYLMNLLLGELALAWFLHSRKLFTVLGDHQAAGIHSDIVVFYNDQRIVRYAWAHPALRPFGNPTPLQCKNCMSIKPYAKPIVTKAPGRKEPTKVQLRCKVCGQELPPYNKPETLLRCRKGAPDRSERGEWYSELLPE